MPPIGMLLGDVDFTNLFVVLKSGADVAAPYATLVDAQAAGAVTVNYGIFINNIISFLIVAFAVFMVIRNLNKMQKEAPAEEPKAPTTKECPFCMSEVSIKATRCGHCTSDLAAA